MTWVGDICLDGRMSKISAIPTVNVGPDEKKKLISSLPKLKGKKILIIGDVGVDEYVMGEVRRISPEAPVPVLEVESEDLRLGLAGNVAQNIVSLGGEALLLAVIGQDRGAEHLTELCRKVGVSTKDLVVDAQRPTTRKSRIMAKHHHVVRVDYENRKFIAPETEKKIIDRAQKLMADVDGVILQDYAKGVVTQTLVKSIVEIAHRAGKKVYVDPHRTNGGEFYSGADLIKPNFDEALALTGQTYDEFRDHPEKILALGKTLQKMTGVKEVVLTRGKEGMLLFSDSQLLQVPTYARKVFDVTGAGDTVIAALTLGLSSGLSLPEACMLANFAAGVVVGEVGCVPCHTQQLQDYIVSSPSS